MLVLVLVLVLGVLVVQVVELEAAEDELESIHQEIQMLQAFNCPQLTRYHGSFIVGRYEVVPGVIAVVFNVGR